MQQCVFLFIAHIVRKKKKRKKRRRRKTDLVTSDNSIEKQMRLELYKREKYRNY